MATIALDDLTLRDPRTDRPLARLASRTIAVHDDLGLLQLTGLTTGRLDLTSRLGRYGGGFQSGRGCLLTSLLYPVPTTALARWQDRASRLIRSTEIRFYAYVDGRPTPGQRADSPGCRR